MRSLRKFAVCGAGMMGVAIAQVLAGIPDAEVTILRSSANGSDPRDRIRENMKLLVAKEIVTEKAVEELLGRVRIAYEDEAIADVDLLIECIPEDMKLKQDLFVRLEQTVSSETILCTNTSVMSPTEIFSGCVHKKRTCGTHFWNPGYLIPLVEVVKTEATADDVIDAVMNLLREAGKQPCLCKKDVPGFIANRMQHALWREAIALVDEGIADAKTVDLACKTSFGLRLPYLPPLANSDMVGTQLTWNIHSYVLKYLADNHEPSPILKKMMEEGRLGFRAEEKDGKREGFMSYTAEQIKEMNEGLTEYLIRMLYNK